MHQQPHIRSVAVETVHHMAGTCEHLTPECISSGTRVSQDNDQIISKTPYSSGYIRFSIYEAIAQVMVSM